MHEFSLVGEQEKIADWVLCTIQKKTSESRARVKRCFQDIGQAPDTETPQDVLLLEDGTQQRKRMHCGIVEWDGPQATETPLEDLLIRTWVDFCDAEFGALFAET